MNSTFLFAIFSCRKPAFEKKSESIPWVRTAQMWCGQRQMATHHSLRAPLLLSVTKHGDASNKAPSSPLCHSPHGQHCMGIPRRWQGPFWWIILVDGRSDPPTGLSVFPGALIFWSNFSFDAEGARNFPLLGAVGGRPTSQVGVDPPTRPPCTRVPTHKRFLVTHQPPVPPSPTHLSPYFCPGECIWK